MTSDRKWLRPGPALCRKALCNQLSGASEEDRRETALGTGEEAQNILSRPQSIAALNRNELAGMIICFIILSLLFFLFKVSDSLSPFVSSREGKVGGRRTWSHKLWEQGSGGKKPQQGSAQVQKPTVVSKQSIRALFCVAETCRARLETVMKYKFLSSRKMFPL